MTEDTRKLLSAIRSSNLKFKFASAINKAAKSDPALERRTRDVMSELKKEIANPSPEEHPDPATAHS